jgi:NADPH:quinone reductase-like Zn-dependent oxidoreductase
MQAIVYDKTQSPRLALREVEKPVPQGSQVLVRVHAVSVNAADYRSMRMGIILSLIHISEPTRPY